VEKLNQNGKACLFAALAAVCLGGSQLHAPCAKSLKTGEEVAHINTSSET